MWNEGNIILWSFFEERQERASLHTIHYPTWTRYFPGRPVAVNYHFHSSTLAILKHHGLRRMRASVSRWNKEKDTDNDCEEWENEVEEISTVAKKSQEEASSLSYALEPVELHLIELLDFEIVTIVYIYSLNFNQ